MLTSSNKKRKMMPKCKIGNYHLGSFELATAECITFNTLQNQMTQHGLGTGIYGFVDFSEENPHIYTYKLEGYVQTEFELENPVVLEKISIVDGEQYSDLGNFTWLSTNLNIVCFELNSKEKSINRQNIIEIFNKNNFFPNEENYYDGIPNFSITIEDIIWVVKSFLHDYNYLQSLGEKNESYVLMPINYLLYYYGFDGVFNKCDDSGRTGSVKYFFSNEYNSRGFRPEFKKREPLNGKLIFLHLI